MGRNVVWRREDILLSFLGDGDLGFSLVCEGCIRRRRRRGFSWKYRHKMGDGVLNYFTGENVDVTTCVFSFSFFLGFNICLLLFKSMIFLGTI